MGAFPGQKVEDAWALAGSEPMWLLWPPSDHAAGNPPSAKRNARQNLIERNAPGRTGHPERS
jgi:hypothetical protein